MSNKKKGVVRVTASIPDELYEKIEQIAETEHRSLGSVIVQACDHYIRVRQNRPEGFATSPEYQALLEQLKKDLGR